VPPANAQLHLRRPARICDRMKTEMPNDLPAAEPSLLTFPCPFPIKVMGRTQDGFAQAIVEIVTRHAPDFDPATLEMRTSSAGNYLSVTATVNAISRAQLDDLYRDLTAHPLVAMVL
jgi:putative lipoic acid-binding regulatory protein